MYDNFNTLDPETMIEMETMRLEFENGESMKEIMDELMTNEIEMEFIDNDEDLPF